MRDWSRNWLHALIQEVLVESLHHWLIDWVTERHTACVTHWVTDRTTHACVNTVQEVLVESLLDWLLDWLTERRVACVMGWLTDYLTVVRKYKQKRCFTDWSIDSLVYLQGSSMGEILHDFLKSSLAYKLAAVEFVPQREWPDEILPFFLKRFY